MKSGLDAESLRQVLALSGAAMFVIIIYAAIWINTLIRVWHDASLDAQSKIRWFLFVLLLSPIGMPAYLILSRKRSREHAAEAAKKNDGDQSSDARRQSPAGADFKAREQARLLEMKKNRILSKEEYARARKRLDG